MTNDPNDRFGMPESAFRAALESHGLDNPTIRFGIYVPTRREVAEKSADWLHPVLIDWMWESPSELTPNSGQIAEVKIVLLCRPDVADPAVMKLIAECDILWPLTPYPSIVRMHPGARRSACTLSITL